MKAVKFELELWFPDDRTVYTSPEGKPYKLEDTLHWEQWIKHALYSAPDNAMYRCGGKVVVNAKKEEV